MFVTMLLKLCQAETWIKKTFVVIMVHKYMKDSTISISPTIYYSADRTLHIMPLNWLD